MRITSKVFGCLVSLGASMGSALAADGGVGGEQEPPMHELVVRFIARHEYECKHSEDQVMRVCMKKWKSLGEPCELSDFSASCYVAVSTDLEEEIAALYKRAAKVAKRAWPQIVQERGEKERLAEPHPELAFKSWRSFRDTECKMAFLIFDPPKHTYEPTGEQMCRVSQGLIRLRDLTYFMEQADARAK